jgi:hypothetical protein
MSDDECGRSPIDDTDRRSLLRAGAAMLGVGASGALGGCTEFNPLDGGEATATNDVSPPDAETVAALPYAPGTIDDVDSYQVELQRPDLVQTAEESIPAEQYDSLAATGRWLHYLTNVDFEETTTKLSFRTTTVLWADYDVEAVAEEMDELRNDYEVETTVDDHDVYVNDDESRAVALDGTKIVGVEPTESEDDPLVVAETVLGTAEGENAYSDRTGFSTLVSALSTTDAARGGVHERTESTDAAAGAFAGEVARGVGATVEDDTTTLSFVMAFDGSVPGDAVGTWADSEAFADYEDVSVATDDATATVTATVSTANFSLSVPSAVSSVYGYIPAPSVVTETDHMDVFVTAARAIATDDGLDEQLTEVLLRSATSFSERTGVDVASIDDAFQFDVGQGYVGDFSASDVGDALTSGSFSADGTYGGFDLYTDQDATFAVDDGVALTAQGGYDRSATDVVRAMVDAASGDVERYVEASEDFGRATEAVADLDYVNVRSQNEVRRGAPSSGEFEGQVASATGFDFEGDTTFYTAAFVFASESSADPDAVRTYTESSGFLAEMNQLSVSREGRAVLVEGRMATDDLV